MPTLAIDGLEFYYEVYGEGFPVVCVHGLGGNHASWYQQVPAFAQAYMAITFDQRGFGNSRDVHDGPGRSRFVEDLSALLDHLDIPRAVLVGQSLGGGTCTGFTVKYPARVAALVLADTVLGLTLPPALQRLREDAMRAAEALPQLERVLGATFRRREPTLCFLYSQLASFNTVTRATLRGSFDPSPIEDLAATGVPTLFIAGSEDIMFPPDVIAEVARLVPGSRYVEVPEAGHSAYFESPSVFNAAVLRFLEGVGIPSRLRPAVAW